MSLILTALWLDALYVTFSCIDFLGRWYTLDLLLTPFLHRKTLNLLPRRLVGGYGIDQCFSGVKKKHMNRLEIFTKMHLPDSVALERDLRVCFSYRLYLGTAVL